VEQDEAIARPEELPRRQIAVDRGGLGRIEQGRRVLDRRQEWFDDRGRLWPAALQTVAPSPRLGDEHLGRRGWLRNDRQAVQGRRQARRAAQDVRLSSGNEL